MDRDTDNSQEKCSGGVGQGCRNGDRGQIFIVCVRHNHHGDDLFIANMMTRLRDAMRCRVDARSSHQAGSEMTTPRCAEFESLKEEQRRPRPRKEEQLEEGMCINRVIWSEGSTRALFSPPPPSLLILHPPPLLPESRQGCRPSSTSSSCSCFSSSPSCSAPPGSEDGSPVLYCLPAHLPVPALSRSRAPLIFACPYRHPSIYSQKPANIDSNTDMNLLQ